MTFHTLFNNTKRGVRNICFFIQFEILLLNYYLKLCLGVFYFLDVIMNDSLLIFKKIIVFMEIASMLFYLPIIFLFLTIEVN